MLDKSTRVELRLVAVAAAFLISAAMSWFGTPTASAATGHAYLSQLTGTPSGPFTQPYGLAVDSSGDLWVSDIPAGNSLVDEFDSSGAFLAQSDGTAAWNPSRYVQGLAWDTAAGKLFAADSNNDDLWGLNPDGSYSGADFNSGLGSGCCYIRAAADNSGGAANGDLYVSTGSTVVRLDSIGGPANYTGGSSAGSNVLTGADTPAGNMRPSGLAVDSLGNLWVADSSNGVVDEFDSTGAYMRQFTAGGVPGGAFGSLVGVAVDAAGNVYALDSGANVVDEFDSSGTFVSQITGAGSPAGSLSGPEGIAVDALGDIYVADTGHGVVDEFGPGELVPDVTTQAPDPVGPRTATLQGAVNPDGTTITDCHFAYVDQADYNPASANPYAAGQSAACTPTPTGSNPVAVSANVTGLSAGTTYHVELFASNSNGTNGGADLTFSTPPPPSIDSAAATNLTMTTADLTAQINPQGIDTTYHFEYGTTTGYGTSIPIPDADIGSSSSDVAVTQHLTALTQDTTYHWRVVATNGGGTATSPDHTFIYDTTGQGLPDNRGYELVTPPDKNGALFEPSFSGGATPPDVSVDGSRVTAATIQCFGGAQSCAANEENLGSADAFVRTQSGWEATALAPSATAQDATTLGIFSASSGNAFFLQPSPPGGQTDWVVRRADGSLGDLGPATPPASGANNPANWGPFTVNVTADGSHLVWQMAQAGFWPFEPSTAEYDVLEYVGTGNTQPLLVGVGGSNSGYGSTDLISACGTIFNGSPGGELPGAISADGRTIFFTASACSGGTGANAGTPVPAAALYARVDNELASAHTVAISQRSPADCTTPACTGSAPENANFEGASQDGTKVFFTSTQQLTDDASQDPISSDSATTCHTLTGANGCNLYLYDFSRPAGHELVDVSATTAPGGPQVQGVVAISADGSRVYFVANGVLAPGAAPGDCRLSPVSGDCSLYVYDTSSGHLTFIATLPAADYNSPTFSEASGGLWQAAFQANVSPDGRFLVFPSTGRLTADAPNANGRFEIFRYDAQTARLTRVSVGEHGFNDNGNASTGDALIVPAEATEVGAVPERRDPTMSDDGSRVFFMSPAALTPHALNDAQFTSNGGSQPVLNVYEWEQAGTGSCPASEPSGCVFLISDGRDTSGTGEFSSTELIGSDATGDNVFFRTADPLVPQDTDTVVDYYDARVGGGFPYTPPSSCSGDACQGNPGGPLAPPIAASVTFVGPGNPSAGATPAKAKVLTKTVRGARFVVRVRVPGRGRIAVSSAGIATVRRSVASAGAYSLRVSLTANERRALARRHRLQLKLRVAFTAAAGGVSAATASVTVKQ